MVEGQEFGDGGGDKGRGVVPRQLFAFQVAADAEEFVFVVGGQFGLGAVWAGVGVFVACAVPYVQVAVAGGKCVCPVVVVGEGVGGAVFAVAVPVEVDGEPAAVEEDGEDGGGVLQVRAFEVGKKMGAYLPAVAPAFDVRFGKVCAQQRGTCPDDGAPVLPRAFVGGFDGVDAVRCVLAQLAELVTGQVEEVAMLGSEAGVRCHGFLVDKHFWRESSHQKC